MINKRHLDHSVLPSSQAWEGNQGLPPHMTTSWRFSEEPAVTGAPCPAPRLELNSLQIHLVAGHLVAMETVVIKTHRSVERYKADPRGTRSDTLSQTNGCYLSHRSVDTEPSPFKANLGDLLRARPALYLCSYCFIRDKSRAAFKCQMAPCLPIPG